MTTTTKRVLLPHPIALVFPAMDADTFNDLVQSMREHGFDPAHPVVTYKGKILDGRNRYKAAGVANVEPVFKDFTGTDREAAEYSLRANLQRRHLSVGQRAMIAKDMLKWIPHEEAGTHKQTGKIMHVKVGTITSAVINNISPRAVAQAQELAKLDPDAAENVKQGKATLGGALRKAKKKAKLEILASDASESSVGVDDAGVAIHPQAAPVLSFDRPKFLKIIKELQSLKRECAGVAKSPAGRQLVFTSAETDFDNIIRTLRYAAPYSSCPLDDPCDASCKLCRGTQWITEGQYQSLPKGMKKGRVE